MQEIRFRGRGGQGTVVASILLAKAFFNAGSWRFFHPKFNEKTAPCSAACPLGQDIARIEMLASWGLLKEAWQTILNENPFPAICGRVCFHPCESVCNRANLDEPIAIHHLERFLGDTAISDGRKADFKQQPANGKKVAIVGGGNTAIDVARSLVRRGVSPLIVYRRRLKDMPAFAPETAMALKEGVKIMELVAPIRIQKNVGDASSSLPDYRLTLQQMKVGKEKIAGRAGWCQYRNSGRS